MSHEVYRPAPKLAALAGTRAALVACISSARRYGNPVIVADLRTMLADVRAAAAVYRGTPPDLIHRDGWDLTTPEARAYFADLDAQGAHRG